MTGRLPAAVSALHRRALLAVALLVAVTGIAVAVDSAVAIAGADPTVSSLLPTYGPESGGTTVTITGTNLTSVTAVDFGTTPAASFTAGTATAMTAVSPAGYGIVDVVVTTIAGTSRVTKNDRFYYGPEVSSVSPDNGPPGGGTTVTISGFNFTEATGVDFGTTPASGYTIESDTTISATSPAGAGIVNVIVYTAEDVSVATSADQFDYGPAVTGVSPSYGPPTGGTSVTITGENFGASPTVNFGTALATGVTVNGTGTEIAATAPAGVGLVNVVVTTSGGTSAITTVDEFSYAPVVSAVAPDEGPATGGTTVAITGGNFTDATAVYFGTAPATSVAVVSDSSITAVSPPGMKPQVPVTVVSPGGTSAANPDAVFDYGPVVAKVKPDVGVGSGGTKVVILGLDFKAVQSVFFGTTSVDSFRVRSSTSIVAIAPAGTGMVDVTVESAAGTSPVVSGDQFDYAPTVVTLKPPHGKAAGGTRVTITGTNFVGVTSVDFGAAPASSYTVVSSKQIVATSPPGTGTVTVTVVSLGGTSTAGPSDEFTY